MTDMLGQEKPSLEELSHHGVKGMKWGVRRDTAVSDVRGAATKVAASPHTKEFKKQLDQTHSRKANREIDLLNRVAAGQGSFSDKAHVVLKSTGGQLLLRGVKGNAAHKSQKLQAQEARINSGQARATDLLNKYGGFTPLEIASAATRAAKLK